MQRLRASRRWRAPSRVWVRQAATAVSPRTAPRYLLPFLALARPARLPGWWSSGARPPQEDQVGAGAEPGHVHAGFGDGVLGGAPGPAGHRPGLLESCSSYGASSRSITVGQPVDLLVDPVDAAEHRLQQGGVVFGEELCALQRPPPAGGSCGGTRRRASWASTLGWRSPAIRWSMMSRPVTPCRSVSTAEILSAADSSSFSARCFSRVRSSVRSRRYRVCSRMTRNSGWPRSRK